MSKSDVVENFASRKINKRTGRCEWKDSHRRRIFCEENTLWSYGYHFPLAMLLGTEGEKAVFVKNGDKYSNTTSSHQSNTQQHCSGPTVSRNALEAAGIGFLNLSMAETSKFKPICKTNFRILFYQENGFTHVCYNTKTKKYITSEYVSQASTKTISKPWTPPSTGMFVPYKTDKPSTKVEGYWHVTGATVIEMEEKGKSKYLLCSMDENKYFVAVLPRKPKSVKDAFESLKPAAVIKAEKAGKGVLRQGEYFFVPTGMDDAAMANKMDIVKPVLRASSPVKGLPAHPSRTEPSPHSHEVRWYKFQNKIYVTGTVYHRSNGLSTGEHKSLKLGDQWYEVHPNTELASWGSSGRMD